MKEENAVNKTSNDSPYVIASTEHDAAIKKEINRRRGFFITYFLERKSEELGRKKFDEQRAKLIKYAGERFDLAQEGKRQYHELEELSNKKLMQWEELEKLLRQWLENDAVGNDWGQDAVEKTILGYRRDFKRNQNNIRARLMRIKDPNADFRKRVLNPETREAAIRKYVQNHIHSKHYTVMALNILFEELEKLRRR